MSIKRTAAALISVLMTVSSFTVAASADSYEEKKPSFSDEVIIDDSEEYTADDEVTEDTVSEAEQLPGTEEIAAESSPGDYGLNWAKVRITPVDGAQYYEIRNKRGNTLIRTVTPEQVGGDILLEGLAPARSFQAVVTAYFADGTGRVTEKFSIRTKSMPRVSDCTVSDRTSTTGTTVSCKVNWTPIDPATGITGFVVCNGSTNEVLATVNDPSATSATIENLSAGDELTVCVRSVLEQNGETYKGAVSIKRWVHCRPQTPVVTFNNSDPSNIVINYNVCQGAMGYMIYTSSDGVNFSRVSIRKGNDNTSYTLKNITSGADTYVRVRAYKKVNETKFYSSYSNTVNVKTSEQRTTTAAAYIYPHAGYGEIILGTVPSGKKVSYLGTEGRWVKISYNGITGYIYNRAMGVSSNKPSMLTVDNMDAYVDDILFESGATPQAICTYVNSNYRYAVKDYGNKTRDQRAYEMLRYRSGSCYYFAALSSYMLERAGYGNMIIDGFSGVGYPNDRHNWVIYQCSAGWRHFDACPMGSYYAGIVWAYTDAQLLANRPRYRWDRSAYPAAV